MALVKFIPVLLVFLVLYMRIGKAYGELGVWIWDTHSDRHWLLKALYFPFTYADDKMGERYSRGVHLIATCMHDCEETRLKDRRIWSLACAFGWPFFVLFCLVGNICILFCILAKSFYNFATADLGLGITKSLIKAASRAIDKKDPLLEKMAKREKIQAQLKVLDSEIASMSGSSGETPYR